MVFYQMEPFGSEAEYLGHAITASTVANAMRDPKKQEAFKPNDFMPIFDQAEQHHEHQSPQEMYLMFKTWALMTGAKNGESV